MSTILHATLFLAGGYLGLRTLAAAYRALDLWYAIGREYPRVVRGIVGWGGATAAVIALAAPPERRALLCGLLAYVLFYLSLFGLRHLVLRKLPPLESGRPSRPA